MKSLVNLHLSVLRNVGQLCNVDVAMDEMNLIHRAQGEGDGYLTIVLPKLAKALEKGLSDGFWPSQDVGSTWDHHRGLPRFLGGFLTRVFDRSGSLLDSPDTNCIWAVRQFCYLTHKVERECSPKRTALAFSQFVQTDEELGKSWELVDPVLLEDLKKVFILLFGDMMDHIEGVIASYDLIPSHGPGAVAERLGPVGKREFAYWPERLETVFPHWRYQSNLPKWKADCGSPLDSEIPVRVISVPKTQSTPRIIAIEPAAMQYAQQGLKREIYEYVARSGLNSLIGFAEQERNQELARQGSISGSLSTLDLSEASDRVHAELVWSLLERWPHVLDFVSSTRSRIADVPEHGIIHLQKFASMGSALTFPIESMVFLAITSLAVRQEGRINISLKTLRGKVSVYGDDIIVPTYATSRAIHLLEHFGAKVNRNKSFWSGSFRESCGAEFYNGTDVSVVRLRQELPSSRGDAAQIAALIDFRNRCLLAGLWGVVREIDEELESFIELPHVSASHPPVGYLHLISFTGNSQLKVRYSEPLQRFEHRVSYLRGMSKTYRIDGEAGLLEWFHGSLTREDLLDRYASQERATSFCIKRGWTSVQQH
nr:MAG: RNA-dependent RNA polymerase [Riboviria sp.]